MKRKWIRAAQIELLRDGLRHPLQLRLRVLDHIVRHGGEEHQVVIVAELLLFPELSQDIHELQSPAHSLGGDERGALVAHCVHHRCPSVSQSVSECITITSEIK